MKYNQNDLSKKEYRKLLIDKCVSLQQVSDAELKKLAKERVQIIIDYLVIEKNINPNRFNIKDTKVLNGLEKEFIKVSLEIKAK